jgi:hypothetical protein
MLSSACVVRRIPISPRKRASPLNACWYSNYRGRPKGNGRQENGRHVVINKSERKRSGGPFLDNGAGKAVDTGAADGEEQPSLMDQLFPEEAKRREEERKAAAREVPRLPLESLKTPESSVFRKVEKIFAQTPAEFGLWNKMKQQSERHQETTVLVLRNASLNLTEEDFRRLIPQGKHVEGWTLEQGDIYKVVPGRNLATLEQENYYYLLFSSQLSAYTYQGHVTRMSRLVSMHMPSSVTSPIPPPPGYMIEGLDAHAAIEAFALIPASQNLELRQLQPPLTPLLQSIVQHEGYPLIVSRKDKSPYEARLTLEGPQLQASSIRYVLRAAAKDLGLSWSGGNTSTPKITKWEVPGTNGVPSPTDRSSRAAHLARKTSIAEQQQKSRESMTEEAKNPAEKTVYRAKAVYIVGFQTQGAVQRFIAFWHRRPMTWKGLEKEGEEDLPPITNVDLLW